MRYIFVYARGNNDDFTKDALLDIVPDGTNLSKYGNLIGSYYISDISSHNKDEVRQFKDEHISLTEFKRLYGEVEYP